MKRGTAAHIPQRHDGDQHEQGAHQREQHIAQARAGLSVRPPHPDQEVGRNEHQLPRHIERQQVKGEEHPDQSRRQHQGKRAEGGRTYPHVLPRPKKCQRQNKRRHDHHGKRQTIHAETDGRTEIGKPWQVDTQLPACHGRFVQHPYREAEQRFNAQCSQGECPGVRTATGCLHAALIPRHVTPSKTNHDRCHNGPTEHRRQNPGRGADREEEIAHRQRRVRAARSARAPAANSQAYLPTSPS